MTNPILYCFISHRLVLEQDKIHISNMCALHGISDFVIVCGGADKDELAQTVLHLCCDDSYEGLPDKIHAMCRYLTKNLSNYKTYAKLDRTVKIIKPLDCDIPNHYVGYVNCVNEQANTTWHFDKCSPASAWNNKPYAGSYVPWCAGPMYLLSAFAIKLVANTPPDLSHEIYEDLYVAKCLLNHANISPVHFDQIDEYFSEDSPQ